MQFGLFYEWPNPDLRNWKTLYGEGVEEIQYSEEMGVDYCLIAEHHFSNYGNSPAPLLQALHIGQQTNRLKIATGILVLPIWQPLRLAEEVAVLDNLIDGRFICGVGRGYQPHEFSRFGVTGPESRQRFSESLEVMIKAWTQDESFTYDGEYIKIPNEVTVWPKPQQKPHPPLWLAGTSVDSMQLAAKWDMMPLTTGLLGGDGMRAHLASLIHARMDLGKSIHGIDLGMQAITHVAETDEIARQEAEQPLLTSRALGREDIANTRIGFKGNSESPTNTELGRVFQGMTTSYDFWIDNGLALVGSPETVIKQLWKQSELCGYDIFCANHRIGTLPLEQSLKSMKLFGEEVIPAFR